MKNHNIGDLLITFNQQENRISTRSASPWEFVAQMDQAQLMVTSPDEGWHGFPLTTCTDDRWQIWALGEFYGNPHPNLSHALETSADLNGHFIIFGYEKHKKRWHILTDRFGTVHAYLANDGKRVALGTFSPSVAESASTKQLDWAAIGGFFQFGFFLNNTTYWRDLQVFPPATHTVFNANGQQLCQRSTWAWHHEPDPAFNPQKALVAFKDCFHTVILEHVHGKRVAVPISGGLDSRSTLIPLTDQAACQAENLFFFSYGYEDNSVEIAIARQLAKTRSLNLQTWTIQPYLFDHLNRVLAASEGFQDLTLTRQANVVDQLSDRASHVLAVHWMDVWLDDMGFLDHTAPSSNQTLATLLSQRFTKKGAQLLMPLFKDCLPTDFEDWVTGEIVTALKKLEAIDDLDFKVKAWKTWQWSFRWTLASLRAYQLGLFTLVSVYDHRLCEFFCRFPSAPLRERAFQIEYLKHFAPDLSHVTWQSFDANLYQYRYYNSWLLPKRALKKLSRILKGDRLLQRNWEVQFLHPKGRKRLENWLLSPGLKLHSFVDRQRLTAFLADFFTHPDAANGYAASMLLTLSAWLEAYG